MANEKPLQSFANIEVYGNFALVKVNPKIFPLSIVVSAAYDLMDKGYFVIDGDPKSEIVVEVRSRKDSDAAISLLDLAKELNNQLINYAFYEIQSARTKGVREIITRAALFGEPPEAVDDYQDNETSCPTCETSESNEVYEPSSEDSLDVDELVNSSDFDDPEGISIPWDEKYGKKSEE